MGDEFERSELGRYNHTVALAGSVDTAESTGNPVLGGLDSATFSIDHWPKFNSMISRTYSACRCASSGGTSSGLTCPNRASP
jgi:hypothetical protein